MFILRNDDDHAAALARIEALWGAPAGSDDARELDALVDAVEVYEARYAIPEPDPVDWIAAELAQRGWSRNELARRAGMASGRVSEILNRRRDLTLAHVRSLAGALDLPPGALLGGAAADGCVRLPAALLTRVRQVAERQRTSVAGAVAVAVDVWLQTEAAATRPSVVRVVGAPPAAAPPSSVSRTFQEAA